MSADRNQIQLAQPTEREMLTLAQELSELIEKEQKGRAKAKDLQRVREIFNTAPDVIKFVFGIAGSVREALVERMAGEDNPIRRELFTREIRRVRASLGFAEASELERLQIERVVLCWIRLQYAENFRNATYGDTITLSDHADRQLTRAQARYHKALDGLYKTRLLLASLPPGGPTRPGSVTRLKPVASGADEEL